MGADEFLVEGHEQCETCDGWIVVVPGRSTKVCADCSGDLIDEVDQMRLRYEVEGRTFTAKAPRKRKPDHGTGPRTAEAKEQRKKLDRARMRTYVKLARIYQPMFQLLFMAEKAREGLNPTATSKEPRPKAVAAELLRDIAEAEEREAERAQRVAGDR